MCGRTSLFPPQIELETRFDASIAKGIEYRPRYNISPGSDLEVITNEASDTIDYHHWGLLPDWADEMNDGLINARSETANEKPAFRDAWAERPCLVLTSGFYEWQSVTGGEKQPFRIYKNDQSAFAMAGLWGEKVIDSESVRSVTILTTEPNEVVAPIHDRMPVVLPNDEEDTWLESDPVERRALCRPYPDGDLDAYPVGTRVNNPSNDDATIIEEVDASGGQAGLGEFS